MTVLAAESGVATLDVKWEEAAKKFVAVGIARRGHSLVGFVGDRATARLSPTMVDVVDGYASKVEDVAVHGRRLGSPEAGNHLRGAVRYPKRA